MKRIIALTSLLALGLTACGGPTITVATSEELAAYPEQAGIIETWQLLVNAEAEGDCETFQSYARSSILIEEGNCEDAFAYMAGNPSIDWSKTQWDANQGKGKIYELNKGGLTSFIYSGKDDVWRFDTDFWSK
ncbi:MAG: hypothetical protein ACI9QC_000482 [Oceanicoccus sp.]|jgi:hypothetical protein